MNPRLMIQRAGEPPSAVELTSPLRAGGGAADELSVPGAPDAAALLSPAADGVVVSARVELVAAGQPLAAGQQRLVRTGQRVVVGSCAIWPEEDEPEGTRALAAAILAGSAPRGGPRLVVLDGPAAGARLPVTDGAVLGRARGSALRLDDPLASRRHLLLRRAGGRVEAEDLGSKNGFRVNGRRVRRGPVRLGDNDELTVGATALLFQAGTDGPRHGGAVGGPVTRDSAPLARTRVAGAVLASGALAAAALALAGFAG